MQNLRWLLVPWILALAFCSCARQIAEAAPERKPFRTGRIVGIVAGDVIGEYVVTYRLGDKRAVYRLRDLPDSEKVKVLMAKARLSEEELDYLRSLQTKGE